jgi:hypothetical protein
VRTRLIAFSCAGLSVGVVLLGGIASFRTEAVVQSAWDVPDPERSVEIVKGTEKVEAAFLLHNHSSRPLRVLGVRSC